MSLLLRSASSNSNFCKKDNETMKWLRKNKDNINVELINLTLGSVIYKDPKTKELLTWEGSADIKVVSMDTLLSMLSNGKALLRDSVLGISDIYYTGKKEITIKDTVKALGFDNIYSKFDYDIKNMDGVIIESDIEKFDDLCKGLPYGTVERLAERFCYLREMKYVDSRAKESSLMDVVGVRQIFEVPDIH